MPITDIHTIIPDKSNGSPIFFKIRKARVTERLFNSTFRSVFNVTVYDCFKFKRIRCLTKNSSFVYLPMDYSDPVMFTHIDNEQCVLSRKRLKTNKTIWLAVVRRFVHNKNFYDIGDIFEIKKPSIFRRLARWFGHGSNSKKEPSNVDVFLHPSNKRTLIPVEFLESHCKFCESPYLRCYRSLSVTIQAEQTPFMLTIPFDPFKRTILSYENNNLKLTTSYFEKVIVDGTDNFDVFITSNSNNNLLTGIIVPENVNFHVELFKDGSQLNPSLTESEILSAKRTIISQIMNLENIEEVIEIFLWDLNNISAKEEDSLHEPENNNEQEIISEIEMQYSVKYKTQKINWKFVSTPSNDNCRNPSVLSYDGEAYVESSDERDKEEKGDFIMIRPKKSNEYLLPLTEFTREYSLFKCEKSTDKFIGKYSDKEHMLPDNVVIGQDGYVKVKEKEEEEKKKKNKEKTLFWKQKQNTEINNDTPNNHQKSIDRNDSAVNVEYYQPSFNIHQEKPMIPKKPLSREDTNNIQKRRPEIPKRSKSVIQYKHSSQSLRPLLLSSPSFEDDESSEKVVSDDSFHIWNNESRHQNTSQIQKEYSLPLVSSIPSCEKTIDVVSINDHQQSCTIQKHTKKPPTVLQYKASLQSLKPLLIESQSFEENENFDKEVSDNGFQKRISYFETRMSFK